VCIRYPKNLKVEEQFVGFLDVSQSQNADSLIGVLLKFLNCLNLDKINIIGQSYDGASVMSGHTGGVQAKLKEIHPKAIYVHCMAHKLNLVVIDMYKHLKVRSNIFINVTNVCIFISVMEYLLNSVL